MREKKKLMFVFYVDAEYETELPAGADYNKKRLEMVTQFFNKALENEHILLEHIKEKFLSLLQWGQNYTEVLSELMPDRTEEMSTSIAQMMPPESEDFINYLLKGEAFYEIEAAQLENLRDLITNQFDEPQIIRAWYTERPEDCQ